MIPVPRCSACRQSRACWSASRALRGMPRPRSSPPPRSLTNEALRDGGVEPEALEKTAAEVIRRTAGIASAYTRSDILSGRLPDTDLARPVRAAYHAERSPDVFLVPEPYWIS